MAQSNKKKYYLVAKKADSLKSKKLQRVILPKVRLIRLEKSRARPMDNQVRSSRQSRIIAIELNS